MVSKKEWKVFRLHIRDVEKLEKIKTISEFRSELVGETFTCTWYFRIVIQWGEELQKFLAGIEGIMNCTKIVSVECH